MSEPFQKWFMIVIGFCQKGQRKIKKVGKMQKYIHNTIKWSIFTYETLHLYQNNANNVEIHWNKTSNHNSRSTLYFLAQIQCETGIKSIPFNDILVKWPDASSIDFYTFRLLKDLLDGENQKYEIVYRKCRWIRKICLPFLRKTPPSKKIKCRYIAKNQCYQIEHTKNYLLALVILYWNIILYIII